jgi:uncharacterized protein DUF3300
MNISFGRGIACLLVCALATPPGALAQAPVPAPLPPTALQAGAPAFNQEQLDQMLAPVALYPDALLAQVLMAATYPLEVVEAARWAQQHRGLTALQDALQGQPWDESVKSLCAFPAVLDRMSKGLAWTQKLGDAFIDQQQQVMDTVQALRRKAQAAGNLQSTPQQTVALDNNAITILPANSQIVYVPTYNPAFVYGSWWWPTYPPYYPSYWGPGLGDGFFWGVGIAAGFALWGGFDWHRHDVHIDVNRYNEFHRAHITDDHWHHDVGHRAGVPYRGPVAQQRYGGFDRRAAQPREQFRGEQFHGPENRSGEMHGGMAYGEERGGEMRGGGMGHEGGHGGGGHR